ncbi:E3 ubiquitin-protein ligase RBBP6 isoform X3 [Cydia amplana]|uniref:E3 ubiquitin-protein ligase RBBP6 isoform X3 n=1 Tax=Cydia amplana TaxID=1869771 RepID=UPI002FE53631
MSVHYKFKSALDYDTVTFDGLHISVGDLKAAISQQKRIGKTSDFDLQITNAQTKEVYSDDGTLIPKNTSLLVARVPLSQQPKKQWEGSNNNAALHKDVSVNKGLADLSRMEGSEQDKINAMISQSTFDYDPSNYQKIRGQNQRGVVPSNYVCYKCQKHGHWIKDCPVANSTDPIEIRRSTGIPRSFMVPVDGPKAPGAMMTPSGTFAVPAVDHEAYLASESAGGAEVAANAPAAPEPAIPDELICSLCRDLLTDAVMIPCCGNSFCDECIRGALLESEDHECPDCREKEIAPTTLIPNRFLRNSVSAFRNQTGYSRRAPHRPAQAPPPLVHHLEQPPPVVPMQQPPNGPPPPLANNDVGGHSSDGSSDNITVLVPPRYTHRRTRRPGDAPRPRNRHGPPVLKPPGMDEPPNMPMNVPRVDEQRASTPTIDEGRDPMASQGSFNRGAPPPFVPGVPPPGHRFNDPGYGRGRGPARRGAPGRPPYERFPPEPYQPPPPGIKDEPNGSRSLSRGRLRRSPWSPRRRRTRDRSLSLTRSPSPRRRHRSPLRYRSPLRSPPRSPLRSPLRSPPRSPLRSPPRSPHRTPLRSPHRTPLRSPHRTPLRSPHRSPHRSPLRSPMRSPRRSAMRSPPPRAMSPHRYPGLYDELLSPPRRNVEPPYGPRYGPRNNGPPPMYPNMGPKPIPPLSSIPIQEPPPGYRGRYDGPPFEDIPPGLEPPVPGFEPSPFEKPPYAPPGPIDRERMPPSNYRDPYRAPFVEGPPGYRDMPMPPAQNEIPVHVGDPPRYRDNYRGPGPYRDQGPMPYRDGQPFREVGPAPPYRDPGFRGGPPAPFRENFRNAPFRDGGIRDNPPHGFREGPAPFRPPSVDPREPPPANYHDPAFRDGFRDENNPGREMRPGYRPGVRNRGPSRRNPNFEQDRYRDPEGRDRERYGDVRDPAERSRDMEKRDRVREDRPREERPRSDRPRDHERNREYEKEREREHERATPEKKVRGSPKRSRDTRDKRRSESRGRSRDRDRDGKRDKKEDRLRDKTSSERAKELKEKEKKLRDKERKKKKREKEKEKDTDKKKKREKKDKKDKDIVKKEDKEDKEEVEVEKSKNKDDTVDDQNKVDNDNITDETKIINELGENNIEKKLDSPKGVVKDEPQNDLYGDEPAEAIDKEIIQNYVKTEDNGGVKEEIIESNVAPGPKEEPFDGIELQITADELDLKADIEGTTEKEMLAPLPELSKWEVDDDNTERKEPGEITSPDEEDSGKVTSEVLKRAENAIFAKAIHSLRPIEIKKISSDRAKLYDDAAQAKGSMNNIQITVPVADPEHRSIEINDKTKKRTSKTPPPRLSVKERLGGKVDDVRRSREPRVVHSTVERVKSRSKTPKKEQPYRRVTVDRDRSKKPDSVSRIESKGEKPRLIADARGLQEKFSSRSPNRDKKRKDIDKGGRESKKTKSEPGVDSHSLDKGKSSTVKTTAERERKKSTLDEAHFEPDYDETVESDHEGKDDAVGKKRERSMSQTVTSEVKKPKLEEETIKLDLANVKKKPDTESESSSDSDTSSSSSSDTRKRKKKKKRSSKKKKKRAASDSDSDSESDSDDHKKKKKKRKHKKKSSKKKKKSKHK